MSASWRPSQVDARWPSTPAWPVRRLAWVVLGSVPSRCGQSLAAHAAFGALARRWRARPALPAAALGWQQRSV